MATVLSLLPDRQPRIPLSWRFSILWSTGHNPAGTPCRCRDAGRMHPPCGTSRLEALCVGTVSGWKHDMNCDGLKNLSVHRGLSHAVKGWSCFYFNGVVPPGNGGCSHRKMRGGRRTLDAWSRNRWRDPVETDKVRILDNHFGRARLSITSTVMKITLLRIIYTQRRMQYDRRHCWLWT